MKLFLKRYDCFVLLLLVFVLSELIVNPVGDFPLNDDWSYGKAIFFTLTRDYTIGGFGAMTLFTHMMWGIGFVKLFGFSFTVLRMSTLASVIINLFFLEKIVFGISRNKVTALLACLVLLFNPLYFNLSNTFMTDVNFNTLLTVCCYCALNFFGSKRYVHLFLFFILCTFLVLLRQYGIVLPACFLLACLLLKEKKWLSFGLSAAGVLVVYLILKAYENYLSGILPGMSPYKFSSGIHITDPRFQNTFLYYFSDRYRMILLHLLVYTAPFAILFVPALARKLNLPAVLSVIAAVCLLVFRLFAEVPFPYMNIFGNMNLGPETFYRVTTPGHTYSETFGLVCTIVKFLFSGITLLTLFLYLAIRLKEGFRGFSPEPGAAFLLLFLPAYTLMLSITESYFDRYHIPFITVVLILLAYLNKVYSLNYKLAFIPLLCFFYVSVSGTKDYLTLNRVRWEAYTYLRNTRHLGAEEVNGGFEINCYNDLKDNWWYDYPNLDNFNYLIQFENEPGFTELKTYPFQRYFPYKKDQIGIFVRIKN